MFQDIVISSDNNPAPISSKEWVQNGWKDSMKFRSSHRIVNKEGKTPSLGFTGQRYQILCKVERNFSYRIDANSLNFSAITTDPEKAKKLEILTYQLIARINTQIKNSKETTAKARRNVFNCMGHYLH
ncbi:MAG: hypothetical protein C5B45_01540 [Chlamydiae bacterium]|nr:MAG: hypothetical protein C5B45_01540 [Chlamydiota bacterium]